MSSAIRLRRQLSLPEMPLWRLFHLDRRELRFRKNVLDSFISAR